MDEMGLDAVNREVRFMCDAMGEKWPELFKTLGLLVEAGFSGREEGVGFYTYARGKRGKKKPNRGVYQYMDGMEQDILDVQKIRERLVLVTVNEAAFCLEEEVIGSPEDGDVGAVLGMGFPPFLGGPFHYADSLGLDTLVNHLKNLAQKGYAYYAPAGILRDMAKRGTRFFS